MRRSWPHEIVRHPAGRGENRDRSRVSATLAVPIRAMRTLCLWYRGEWGQGANPLCSALTARIVGARALDGRAIGARRIVNDCVTRAHSESSRLSRPMNEGRLSPAGALLFVVGTVRVRPVDCVAAPHRPDLALSWGDG